MDSIRPKCHELRQLCDQFAADVGRRRGLLGRALDLHGLLEAVGPPARRTHPTPRRPAGTLLPRAGPQAPVKNGPFLWPRRSRPNTEAFIGLACHNWPFL